MNPSNYMEYRDLQYEQENIAYDFQYPEGGIKCKNYELCEHILSPDWWENLANYLCMTCGSWFGWNELEFRESDEECVVCYETSNKQVKFPTNCGHWFCCKCSRDILFWDETRYHLSPESFGCPPCPNGCINPIKGKQCDCDEYFNDEEDNLGIIQIWQNEYPEQFEEYNNAENESIELSETTEGCIFGSKKCPLCRKKYE